MANQPQIRVLSDNVANKIAAGEVVERPASLVKELVENAVDAGSTQIDIDIIAGGRKLVSVGDNGCGMNRDNALLAIERHATSKIRDVDDIEHIATLGFRGEALAAIASVARFRIATCARDEDMGTEVVVDGGKLRDVRDIGCPAGTTIEVRDLFYRVPARRKFLRSYQTEMSHVRSTFIVLALANPAVGMSLRVDGREAYHLPAGAGFSDRLADIFGRHYGDNLRAVDHDQAGVRITGYVSIPTVHRADRGEQYTFVNGRAATAPLVGYAIKEAYHTLLPGGRHPSVFLFLSLDPELVDVNVHPTKREVRFRRPSDVRDALIAAIRAALSSDATGKEDGEAPGASGVPAPSAVPTAHVQLNIEDLPETRTFRYPRMPATGGGEGGAASAGIGVFSSQPSTPEPAEAGVTASAASRAPWSWCRVLGQVGGLYVLLETEEGYVVMDPCAAHERVLFERYMRDLERGEIASQNLLMPETVELQPRDARCVRKHIELLTQMGFGVSEFGGDTFVVDALPSCFSSVQPAPLLVEVAHGLEQAGSRKAKGHWREESIAQTASRTAVQARDKLTLEEIEQLVVDLAGTDMPYTCPHGRPTLIFTSLTELNRKFGRS